MLEADHRLWGRCVGQALEQAARQRGWSQATTVCDAALTTDVMRL